MGKHVSFGFESYRGCEAVYDHVLVMHPKGVIWQTFPVTGGEEHMRYYVVSCDNTGPGAFRVKYKDAHGTILAEHTKYFAGGGVRFMAWHTVPDGAVEGQLSIHNWHSWDKPVTLRQAGLK